MQNKRRIIYVDATGINQNTNFKIGLYDSENNATHIMDLIDISNSSLAEKYAVFYSLLYVQKFGYENCMILCDNISAVKDETLVNLSKNMGTKISWIPREINTVADKICKLEPTLKESDWNILKLFVHLSEKIYMKSDSSTLKLEVQTLKEELSKKNTKIKNQAQQINSLKKN